jgi:transcriptional regulator with XRE-family HTH domain
MGRSGLPDDDVRAFYEELGSRVREARKARSMTQGQLALRLGLTRTSVVNLEAGRQGIPVHTLVRAATALGVAITSLVPEHPRDSTPGPRRPPGVAADTPQQHLTLVNRLLATAGTEGHPYGTTTAR